MVKFVLKLFLFIFVFTFIWSLFPKDADAATYRYVKWVITKRKGTVETCGNTYCVQASEFRLTNGGSDISYTGVTATNPGGTSPLGEEAPKGIDSSLLTKWLDQQFNSDGGSVQTGSSTLLLDAGSGNTMTFDGYRYATGNDATDRDPVSWTVQGSSDNSNWTVLDTRSDQTITNTRQTYTSVYTVGDTTAPTITNVTSDKANGSYGAGTVIDIDVTFSEAVTSTGNVTVILETGATDRTCTFTVSNSTTGTCNYTVQSGDTSSDLTVNSISGTINDQSQNAMTNFIPVTNLASNKAIVIDTTNPSVSTLSPADGVTNASTNSNLVITFTETVVGVTGNITIKKTSDNSTVEAIAVGSVTGSGSNTITVNPTNNLTEQTDYYVIIDATAFDDAAGNGFAGISNATTWNFTTADETSPSVSAFIPTDNATDVALDANLVINFSESMVVGSGNITIYKSSDNSIVEAIDVTSGQISGSGTSTITINPSSNLTNGTSYYVQIDSSAFDDSGGNSYAGINDTTTWNFTTITASSSTSSQSSSSSSNNSNTCTNAAPTSAPDLFQIDGRTGEVTVYFTPTHGEVTGYVIEYGTTIEANQFAVAFDHADKSGAVPYTVRDLRPNMTWYFKVSGKNGCSSGPKSTVKESFAGFIAELPPQSSEEPSPEPTQRPRITNKPEKELRPKPSITQGTKVYREESKPEMKLPELSAPDVNLPSLRLPKISLPDFEVPNLDPRPVLLGTLNNIKQVFYETLTPAQSVLGATSTRLGENVAATIDIWFDDNPTTISNLRVKKAGKDYAIISWETNHYSTSKVSYGDSYDYGLDVQLIEKVKDHEIKITGLKPGKTYYYEVMSHGKTYSYDARHEFKTLE